MKTRKEIYDIYLNDFAVSHRMEKFKNSNFVPTNDFIEDSLAGTLSRFKKDLGNALILNEEEKDSVIKKIKSIYAVFQEEGDVILGDYNHDYDWYKNRQNSKDYKTYFRDRYKQYLLSMKNFSTSVVEVLENDTLQKLMSYLGNPIAEEGFSCRGLVVGDVQSGKTSNYLGLITKASDAGYRVIFVLTGMIESLRRQTQQRIEEGFIGYDSINGHDVGVGRGDPMPMAFTSREKDFVNKDDQNTTYKLSNYSTIPFIFVLKKNVSVLKEFILRLKILI